MFRLILEQDFVHKEGLEYGKCLQWLEVSLCGGEKTHGQGIDHV